MDTRFYYEKWKIDLKMSLLCKVNQNGHDKFSLCLIK